MNQQQNRLNTVLVVDDDCILRSVACSFFSGRGVPEILEAENGEMALGVIENHERGIDFIISDLQMPKMDGFQFLRHLDKLKFRGPVAILSGFEKSIIELARDLAEHHHLRIVGALQKPLDIEALENIYSFLLEKQPEQVEERIFELLGEDLEKAINHGQILSLYQPKISLSSGHIVGVEALTCWDHHIYGILPREQFIELARQHRLVHNLETLQLETVFRNLEKLRQVKDEFKIAVNVDMDILGNHDFPDFIAFLVETHKVSIENLAIEIRADQLTQKNLALMEIFARLRSQGALLVLDHLGFAKSCLEHVRQLPFSEVKLDRSIVRDAFKTPYLRDQISSHMEFAHERKLQVTGLGVETPGDLEFLARMKVDFAQGYFPARPMPIDAMTQWVKEYERKFSAC